MPRAMIVVTICFLLVSSGGSSASGTGKQEPLASVHLVPVYIYGEELQSKLQVETFKAEGTNTDFASHFHQNTGGGIPYGIYIARVRAEGFWSSERLVRVFQPTTTVVFALDIGMLKSEGGAQTGVVVGQVRDEGIFSDGSVWVRLFGVYSGVVIDAKTDRTGNFSFQDVPYGSYVVTAFQKDKILPPKLLRIPAASPVIITADNLTR